METDGMPTAGDAGSDREPGTGAGAYVGTAGAVRASTGAPVPGVPAPPAMADKAETGPASADASDAAPTGPDVSDGGLEHQRMEIEAVAAVLDEVDLALARLDAGDYRTCEACGTTIAEERLAEQPTVRTCEECAPTTGDVVTPGGAMVPQASVPQASVPQASVPGAPEVPPAPSDTALGSAEGSQPEGLQPRAG